MSINVSDQMKRFNNLISEMNEAYHDVALKLELSDSAMQILYVICNGGGECLLSEIVQMSGISKQTINSAMRKLENEGVVITEDATARKKLVRLSEKGKQLAKNTVQKVIDIENEIFASWTQEEWQSYFNLTKRYITHFKERAKEL